MPEEEKQHQSRSEKNFSTLHCARTRSRIPQRPLGRSSLPLSTKAVPARADSRQPSRLFPQRFHFPLASSFIHSIDSSAAWRTKSASCSHLRQRLFPQRLQCHLLTGVWPVRVEQKIPCSRSRNRFPQRVGARPVHPHPPAPPRQLAPWSSTFFPSFDTFPLSHRFKELLALSFSSATLSKAKCRKALHLFVQTRCPDPSFPPFDDGCAFLHHSCSRNGFPLCERGVIGQRARLLIRRSASGLLPR